jgi:hypothetical protein
MKQFYVLLGQTKDEDKQPILHEGWYKNKKDAHADARKHMQVKGTFLYGVKYNIWEFIVTYIIDKGKDMTGILIRDLK